MAQETDIEEDSLFDFGADIEEVDIVDTTRMKQPYKEVTVRAPTKTEVQASTDGIFDELDEFWEKPPLVDIYVSQAEIRNLVGTNGLTSLSLFTGCGGSLTGFAWAGWKDQLAVEFVKAARESLAANYESYLIEPEDVLVHALKVAEKMGVARYDLKSSGDVVDEDGNYLVINKKRRVRKVDILPSIDWEATLASLGGQLAVDFRAATCASLFDELAATGHTGMPIWGDDVRALDPDAAMNYLGMKRGDLDCLEGSPPCKSFSVSGIREKGWGNVLRYSDERDQRTDDLFLEYLRFLDGFYPKSFVAENVAGIGMGSADTDVMAPLMEAFSDLGYNVEARVLNSDRHSVAQSRPRMIFVGIRKDLVDKDTGIHPGVKWPVESDVVYSCQDALDLAAPYNTKEYLESASLEKYESGRAWHLLPEGGAPENKMYQMIRCHSKLPVPTITATSAGNIPSAGPTHPHECRKFTIPEYRALFSFGQDYVFTGDLEQQGERMGRSVPPHMMKRVAETLADIIKNTKPYDE